MEVDCGDLPATEVRRFCSGLRCITDNIGVAPLNWSWFFSFMCFSSVCASARRQGRASADVECEAGVEAASAEAVERTPEGLQGTRAGPVHSRLSASQFRDLARLRPCNYPPLG